MTSRSPDPLDPFLGAPVDDDEYVWAQWAGTKFLMEQTHDWSRIARDESLMDGVRVFAAERARCICEELRPA